MGKVLKKITALLLCVVMIVPAMSFEISAENESFKEYTVKASGKERTSSLNTYICASPKHSYMYENNNNIVIVDVSNFVSITTYTKNFEIISEKTLSFELPFFGGFYSGKNYNFIIFGQNNYEEIREKESYRIVKYDKDFNRIDHASIISGECLCAGVFDAGTVSWAECGDELAIHLSHEWYVMFNDGLNHQGQFTIVLNTQTMSTVNEISSSQGNFVSHSFNQFVRYDDGLSVYVDHGDGNDTRGVVLQKKISPSYSDRFTKCKLLTVPGESGNNYTGISVGGFEISENNYIVSINTIDQNNTTGSTKSRDAVLLISSKNNTSEKNVKQILLADYIKNNKHATAPYLVKLSEKRFVAIWKEYLINNLSYEYNGIKYVLIDENGNKLSEIKHLDSSILLSDDCQPILVDKKILWYYNSEEEQMRHICSIDLSTELICEHSLIEIQANSATCFKTGNNEYYECTNCTMCFKDSEGRIATTLENETIGLLPHQGGEATCSQGKACSTCGLVYTSKAPCKYYEPFYDPQPTCTTRGTYWDKYCMVCKQGSGYGVPATGHTYEEWEIITAPTCTTEGIGNSTCITCGEAIKNATIPATGHDYSTWTILKEATCTQEGKKTALCKNCEETITEIIPTTEHIYEDAETILKPTCLAWGYKLERCINCYHDNNSYNRFILGYRNIPPVNHETSEWVTIQIPASEKPGEKIRICSTCNEVIERKGIPVSDIPEDACTNHTPSEEWENIIEPGCLEYGLKVNKCSTCNYTITNDIIDYLYHDYETVIIREPSCYLEGINHAICTRCDYMGWSYETDRISCTVGEWETVTEPNCGNPGLMVKKCTMCGEIKKQAEIPALTEHTPGEWEIIKEVSCSSTGEKVLKCTGCNEIIETETIPIAHTPGAWEVVTAATCTTVGKKVQKCTGCGEIVDEEIIPTSEHTAGEWQYAMYPTCSKEGMEVLKCTVCGGQIEYRSVPALPHTPGEWVVVEEAKCGVDGRKAINCTVCHIEIESEIIDAPEHVESDWIILREPTCSKEGIKQKRCTVCLEYISDRYEKIDKLPHSPASYWTNVSNATCTEDGLKIKKCTVCGGTAEELIIEATGHVSGEWKTIISPTCNGAGVKIKTCNVCGQESQRIEINPTGHTPASEWTVRKLATCTEDGEMYKKCIVCNMDAETQIIDALGHNLDSEWVIEQNATCTEDGIKTQNCTRCDHSVSETIPATGHTETGWLITATADCLNSGTKIKKCTVCGIQTDSVSIPATGHTVGEWEILETSTCSREGTKVKRCSDCGTVTKSESIPRSGHEKGNWVITETPTGGSYGVKARFCIGCGMKMEEKIIYSVSNIVVKDDATGVEVVYPDGTFTGTMTLSARNLAGSEIGSKIYSKLGECNFRGYEVKFFENGIQVNPSNTYSVRIPVPYSFNRNSAEVYGISMTTGELYKVAASYENGYFLIENADTIQYVITEKIITVSLSQTHLDMKKGDTVQLYAYTNGQNVTFTSSNPSVATVDIYGNVTAVGNGSAVITATVDGTTVKEECTVEVTQSFFDMIISAISEAFSGFLKFFTDIFKSINGSLS